MRMVSIFVLRAQLFCKAQTLYPEDHRPFMLQRWYSLSQ